MTETTVIDELESMLKDSMAETFNTMLNMPITAGLVTDFVSNEPQVAAAVGFIGELTGVVYIYVNDSFARKITSRMLGMPEAEIDGHEMVNDTMGEMGNMVVGQIKSRLCDTGRKCVLTIPSIVRGMKFCVEPISSSTSRKLGFASAGNPIMVEIIVKLQENNS